MTNHNNNLPPGTTEQHINERFGDEKPKPSEDATDEDSPTCPECGNRTNQYVFIILMPGRAQCNNCQHIYDLPE